MAQSKVAAAYTELVAAGEAVKPILDVHPIDREALAASYERISAAARQLGNALEDELPKLASTHAQLQADSPGAEQAAQLATDSRDALTAWRETAYASGDAWAEYAAAIRLGDEEKGEAAEFAVRTAEHRMNGARDVVGELMRESGDTVREGDGGE